MATCYPPLQILMGMESTTAINFNGFGGDGIHPVDTDGGIVPDYLDSDTDNDGLIDRIEGNDLNLNGQQDDW